MFTKLEDEVVNLLCCPFCKGVVEIRGGKFACLSCQTEYPKQKVQHREHEEYVYDFRLHRPAFCVPSALVSWAETQEWYEKFHDAQIVLDNYQLYLDEIDSVKEIYEDEYALKGSVLDVGGHQGRVRHFLNDDVSMYVSVDPFLEVFKGVESQPNLLRAYPSLREACNFLSCHAENLPFQSGSFDWVHMRSNVDHFYDPYATLKEAFRVLRPGGTLLIGLAIHAHSAETVAPVEVKVSGASQADNLMVRARWKLRKDGIGGLASAVVRRMKGTLPVENSHVEEVDEDRHMYHWEYQDLINLVQLTNFTVSKEHWQKAPFESCIYLSAKK